MDSDRKVVGHCSSTVPFKRHWCAFHIVQLHTSTFISLISDSHTKDIDHFHKVKMFNSVLHNFAHHAGHQDRSAHVHDADVGDQSGSIARTAHSTGFGTHKNCRHCQNLMLGKLQKQYGNIERRQLLTKEEYRRQRR